jgi:hypothetical protein
VKSAESRAENERLFRGVNEKVKDLNEVFEAVTEDPGEFICECDDLECQAMVFLAVSEFERIHANERHFILVPGHEAGLEFERVVERCDGYVVVEKRVSPSGP